MSNDVSVDEPLRILTITFSGSVSHSELLALAAVTGRQYRGNGYSALADFTKAKVESSAREVRTFAQCDPVFHLLAICGLSGSAEYGLARMFQTYCGNQAEVGVFSSCEEARQWLRTRACRIGTEA
jgi:hypothetical protein